MMYSVKKGDSLWKIALTQLGDPSRWKEIAKINNIAPPYKILPNQFLRLPEVQKSLQQARTAPVKHPLITSKLKDYAPKYNLAAKDNVTIARPEIVLWPSPNDPVAKAIQNGKLAYTCNCGWVDTSHATDPGDRPYVGAKDLWKQVSQEKGKASSQGGGYQVVYAQDAYIGTLDRRVGGFGSYFVRYGLSLGQKKSVALAIFQEVSFNFESMQGLAIWSDSSFSQEDLVSNLLGFYSAVEGKTFNYYMGICGKVSQNGTLEVYRQHGSPGSKKNKKFEPILYSCSECSGKNQFPKELQTIKPAEKGIGARAENNLFRNWKLYDE